MTAVLAVAPNKQDSLLARESRRQRSCRILIILRTFVYKLWKGIKREKS